MTKNLIGRFYFKQTNNGNLVGEFSNNLGPEILTESANLKEGGGNFLGTYNSTWLEKNKPFHAVLTITQKSGSNHKIFSLKWSRDNKTIFVGEGMMCDNTLIGDYQDVNGGS